MTFEGIPIEKYTKAKKELNIIIDRKTISNLPNTKRNFLEYRYCRKKNGIIRAVTKPAPPPGRTALIAPVETKKLYKNIPGKYTQNIM